MILQDIVKKKKERLIQRKTMAPFVKIKAMAYSREETTRLSFLEALKSENKLSIIAEVKKASPSKGIISENFDYLRIAKEYEAFGASCISVLTEEDFFLGSDTYLTDIVKEVKIPIIRKDFVVDEYQIYESKLLGASAILLICRILSDNELREFYSIAKDLGMDALVETHDEEEVKRAIKLKPEIIGINNRNLDTFTVSLETSKNLIKLIPEDMIKISESGIFNGEDMGNILDWGFDGVLVGEALMKSNSLKESLQEIIQGGKRERS